MLRRTRLQVIFPLLLLPFLMNAQSWQELHKNGKKAYQEGKYEEAHENFVSAQRLAPDNVDLSKDIGTAAYRMGDYDSAEDIFTRKAQNSATSKLERAKKWHNVGNSQMKKKNYAEAVESYKNALRLNPNSQQTRYNYAEAKRRLAQQEENQDEDKDQNQDSDDSDSQNDQNDDQQSDNNQNDSQNDSQENDQNSDQQDQNTSEDQQKSRRDAKNQRNVDKTLEELLKREMETKKKVKGYKKGEESESKSNKKW